MLLTAGDRACDQRGKMISVVKEQLRDAEASNDNDNAGTFSAYVRERKPS